MNFVKYSIKRSYCPWIQYPYKKINPLCKILTIKKLNVE